MKLGYIIRNNPFAVMAICFAAAFGAVSLFLSVPVGIVELVLVLSFLAFAVRYYLNTLARKKEQVRVLSRSLLSDDAQDALFSFPLAAVLVEKSGEIVWYNTLFESILADFSTLKNCNINALLPFTEKVVGEKCTGGIDVNGGARRFSVYPAALANDRYALYFVDDTALKDIRTKYDLSRPVVLLVNVDSLEQAEDIMAHEDYYGLNSDIDRMITKWFVENNCVFRKFTDGRFFAVTEYQNLTAMIENRFGIIDKIRSAHLGSDEFEITLSIGVGHSLGFRECEENAREALDMARGRGGDQVAVKNGDAYEFFGGVSSGKEKRGKIKSRAFAAALDEYIEQADNVLIMGHAFSDFDCIGAGAGIVAIARAKAKNVHIVVDKKKTMAGPLVRMLENGAGAISFISPEAAPGYVFDNTLLVVVDTMRSKLVEAPALLNLGLRTVIIDHHRMAVDHIEGNTFEFMEPHASSACEMVTELVQYSPAKPKLTQTQAQALLAGIMLDTKDYTLRVGVRTFDAASFLKSCKADTVAVRELFCGSAEDNIQVNNIVNAAVYFDRYAISVSSVSGASARLVCSKAADELLSIENIDASFVISSFDNVVNISARSLGRLNVQLIMEKLGGGGHHSMAAAQLKDVTAQEAFDLLKKTIDDYQKENS